mgnify:CR=1 FL=1
MIKKGITVQQIIDANKKISKYSFKAKYTTINGFPTETEQEIKDTVKMALRLINDNKNAYVSPYNWEPLEKTK